MIDSEIVSAEWLASKIGDRSIRGIALDTSALIRAGVLPLGSRLPPIRDIAFALHVSPATISEAWRELRRLKVITGRGRNGTWISGNRFVSKPERLWTHGDYGTGVLDLAFCIPDVSLLPPLEEAMGYAASLDKLNSYERSRIIPELRDAVQDRWPYEPEAFLTVNGGYNGAYTAMHALLTPGSIVAIENPTALRLLDILEDLGVKIVPVTCDEHGPTPASLAQALKLRPAAFVFQPRLHAVTGKTVSPLRLAELGDILASSEALIIEDDGLGDISGAPPVSLGGRFPDRTIHVISYSKSLGPDLRIAVLSSSEQIIDQLHSYRAFSAGWTSRLLQGATAWLLRNRQTWEAMERTRQIYRDRRNHLAAALTERGVAFPQGDGLGLWLPVASEQFAMVTLAARNIAVAPGSKFSVSPNNHIRVATSILADRYDEVADAIALAHVT